MRSVFHKLGLCHLLVALVALWAMPALSRGIDTDAHRTLGTTLRAAGVASVSPLGDLPMDVQAPPRPVSGTAIKHRGRTLLSPLGRLFLLSRLAWLLAEPEPVPFDPPANHLPPSARPLLASLPDRAPPIV